MKTIKVTFKVLFIILTLLPSEIIVSQFSNDCQNKDLSGNYVLIKDSDGKMLDDGAGFTLTLSGNSAKIQALFAGTEIISEGEFHACDNLITISFSNFDFGARNQSFSINGSTLELPFKALDGRGEGSSIWKKTSDNEFVSNEDIDPFSGEVINTNNFTAANDNKNKTNTPKNNLNFHNNSGTQTVKAKHNSNQSLNRGNSQNISDNSRSAINQYVGDYIGTGWGWEVRFKHTSGDFVSQFTGTKKNELPFDGDKVIMSLLVEHATKFKIHIDENNQVTGEGEIVYNVIPNLCGLAVLTEQVNAAVNLMGEFTFFFNLGKDIAQASVKSFTGKFLGMQGNLAKSAKIASSTGGNLINEYIGMKLPEKMKALDLEGQQSNALCNCASGQAAIIAGNKVGPSTIKELILSTGPDVAKALFMDMATGNLPVGMILSIPGVTQVQYEYKGLQNGPETRKFKIKGHLTDGQLFLQMDGDVFEGSKKLTIQYTVNYKTERPTFPSWSPFIEKAGEMKPAGSEATLYEQIEKIKTQTFTDAATGKIKTIQIPYNELVESHETLPFPFATFREAGKQRNGVKVWHEYEYNWNVFKVPEEK